jgi:subtilisin family serine protease
MGCIEMIRYLPVVILWFGFLAPTANAEEAADAHSGLTKILVTFSDPAMSNSARAGPARPGYRRGSSTYLVSVNLKRAANRIAEDFDLITIDEWPVVSLKVHCLVYGTANSEDIEDVLHRLRQRPEVDSAQLLNEFEVSASVVQDNTDTYSGLQHSLATLELMQAHNWSRGDGTRVSIIDTGADFEHPELKARITSHHDFVTDRDGDFSADVHGTAVAGVIGADSNNEVGIIGVAPSAKLSVLKACWHRPEKASAVCNSFTLAKALDHAIGSDTDIINLSLNGPSDPLLGRLVEQALMAGIVVVAAAPDQAFSGFPAGISGVIVAGFNNRTDADPAFRQTVINAPGEDILVPVPAGGYDFASGSSLSAAHVSGIAALLVARQPALSPGEIKSLLLKSQLESNGSVNACRALAELLAQTGCRDAVAANR